MRHIINLLLIRVINCWQVIWRTNLEPERKPNRTLIFGRTEPDRTEPKQWGFFSFPSLTRTVQYMLTKAKQPSAPQITCEYKQTPITLNTPMQCKQRNGTFSRKQIPSHRRPLLPPQHCCFIVVWSHPAATNLLQPVVVTSMVTRLLCFF